MKWYTEDAEHSGFCVDGKERVDGGKKVRHLWCCDTQDNSKV